MTNPDVIFERDISIISESWIPKLNPMLVKTLLASKEGVAYLYPTDVKNPFGMKGGRLVMKRVYMPRSTEICYSVYYDKPGERGHYGHILAENLDVDKAIETFLRILNAKVVIPLSPIK